MFLGPGTICCDRSSNRSDTCLMKGDVRTHSLSSSIYLYTSRNITGLIDYVPSLNKEGEEGEEEELQLEKIRPYTRKWETSVMDTIDELHIISKRENSLNRRRCDVHHDVPGVLFSTGGYTGNIYHDFNDGILPLYITSQHLNKRVVFVILEYHNWWFKKYGDILSLLSDFPPIDFRGDNRTHCFEEAIVGLRIHDELAIDSSLMEGGKTIQDFRDLLDRAYWPRIKGLIKDEEREAQLNSKEMFSLPPSSKKLNKPKLVILSRNGSRVITNEDLMVKMAEQIGDVMVGVHGAAMTHFLFLKPGSVFIQVVPLGTEWPAKMYYGEPAMKLGLKYIGYKIVPRESSLHEDYDKNDPVLRDPSSVVKKGWEFTKKIYLDRQNVRLNLGRFRKKLVCAYNYSVAKKNRPFDLQSH
ncbi:glycosyltransferase family 61 protein [Actinidia rufa]|uniref:Glycosyltransferase family 61 protein n=1 Tax=Actinidia rufa TaxID=165716 RepID=A0A7J0FBX8_9ERIC|nr:glycosyltransferase family 61 protein [Actinidia rufa]